MRFERYAIYYAPKPGPLADFAAAWLGWDLARGKAVPHPEIAGLSTSIGDLTGRPRKYGFHGTIKPPFRLAKDQTPALLATACRALAERSAPIQLDGLELSKIGRFLALTVTGDTAPLSDLAATVVRDLDRFRAPATESELQRRRQARLSPAQDQLLLKWGYPHVMDEFRFHLTLTGPLEQDQRAQVKTVLLPLMKPLLPSPFEIDDLTLVGEDADGRFREIERFRLGG